MEWFTENWTPNIKFSVKIKKHLHSETTPFQQLEVYDSFELGRFFTLDGIMMANEKDEFIYHEMIIHTPMSINPSIKNVLVIGGGDGGSVRELTKYDSIESIDMVEIDERVVRVCQEYFKITTTGLNDPRVSLKFEDGLAYVKNTQKVYDLVIVDSTDPIGPGEGLFSMEFYSNCKRVLADDGILINQHESPYFEKESTEMKRAHKKIKSLFPIAEVYQAFIPTYPSGHWLFGFASKKYHPIKDFKNAYITSLGVKTRYYNGDIHQGSFALPNYVRNALKEL
ncbi:MAG: polyamine aminopropyltransferase [Tenericutes bacterium]|nr:polyamine aminopropyltransferase [Mycoplasmatota bacterium]